MANVSNFKQYGRNKRQATLENDFSKGMMFNNGTVDFSYAKTLVNYTFSEDKGTLVPRPGLQLDGVVFPVLQANDFSTSGVNELYNNTDVCIKAAKDCVEADGKTYKQIILGKAVSGNTGKLFVNTSEQSDVIIESNTMSSLTANVSVMDYIPAESDCSYLVTDFDKIHGLELSSDSKISALIGTFAFGNEFYFINPTSSKLCKTKFNSTTHKYEIDNTLTPKDVTATEAVTYGYNMLLSEPYSFSHDITGSGLIQLTGILPYNGALSTTLLMSPKKNQEVTFRCSTRVDSSKYYRFDWDYKVVDSDTWISLDSEVVNGTESTENPGYYQVTSSTKLQATFVPPAENIIIRVQAYQNTDIEHVEKAMSVGFDFTNEGETTNLQPEIYDLTTATGMTYWKSRLVVYGLPEDPTILFISDVNEPTYFPYPNNISVFEEPIVSVVPFMDSLLVFTTSRVYQVSLDETGTGWTSTVLQSNLYIAPWDRHLIQVVRNMIFFKSGNYYYMIVPKAQSMTGELTLAPISTPLVDFFNNFGVNLNEILKDVFDYEGDYNLINYYNFLDYEDIHNIYVIDYDDNVTTRHNYLHLDILYNTVTRAWKIYTFDVPHLLYPYRNDATQTGTLASTSIIDMQASIGTGNATIEVREIETIYNKSNIVYMFEQFNFAEVFLATDIKFTFPDGVNVTFQTASVTQTGVTYTFTEGNYKFDLIANTEDVTALCTGCLYTGDNSDAFTLTEQVIFDYIYDNGDVTTEAYDLYPKAGYVGKYVFNNTSSIQNGSIIELDGVRYTLNTTKETWLYDSEADIKIRIRPTATGAYYICFDHAVFLESAPIIKVYNVNSDDTALPVRCIQFFKFNPLNTKDLFIPSNSEVVFNLDYSGNVASGYSPGSIISSLVYLLNNVDDYFCFKNWQFLDTGYRDDSIQFNKRYRELQFQINNIDSGDLEFSMEFRLNGQTRRRYYMYQVEQVVDQESSDYGLLYMQSTPYSNIILQNDSVLNETTLATYVNQNIAEANTWHLDQSAFPDVSFWRVRMHISGKGQAPRIKLLSKNETQYELMGLSWVYRVMNMR